MKPFHELTRRGKTRRIRKLACQALSQYDLDIKRIALVSDWTNTIFRVFTIDKASYMLRVCRPGWRIEADLRSEIIWLRARSLTR